MSEAWLQGPLGIGPFYGRTTSFVFTWSYVIWNSAKLKHFNGNQLQLGCVFPLWPALHPSSHQFGWGSNGQRHFHSVMIITQAFKWKLLVTFNYSFSSSIHNYPTVEFCQDISHTHTSCLDYCNRFQMIFQLWLFPLQLNLPLQWEWSFKPVNHIMISLLEMLHYLPLAIRWKFELFIMACMAMLPLILSSNYNYFLPASKNYFLHFLLLRPSLCLF